MIYVLQESTINGLLLTLVQVPSSLDGLQENVERLLVDRPNAFYRYRCLLVAETFHPPVTGDPPPTTTLDAWMHPLWLFPLGAGPHSQVIPDQWEASKVRHPSEMLWRSLTPAIGDVLLTAWRKRIDANISFLAYAFEVEAIRRWGPSWQPKSAAKSKSIRTRFQRGV